MRTTQLKRDINALKNIKKRNKKELFIKNKPEKNVMIFWNNFHDEDDSGFGMAITSVQDKKKWVGALAGKNEVVEYLINKKDIIFDDLSRDEYEEAASYRDGVVY